MYNLPLNSELYGNKDLIPKIKLMISYNSNNSFLIGGPVGVGKANFVYKLSKYLLCHFEYFSKTELKNKENIFLNDVNINKSSHLFDSNTHPDFFNLSLNNNSDDKKIPIDNVRKLNIFFQKTFSVSKIKIAVINTIDDLSINSVNLLLKTEDGVFWISLPIGFVSSIKKTFKIREDKDVIDLEINAGSHNFLCDVKSGGTGFNFNAFIKEEEVFHF